MYTVSKIEAISFIVIIPLLFLAVFVGVSSGRDFLPTRVIMSILFALLGFILEQSTIFRLRPLWLRKYATIIAYWLAISVITVQVALEGNLSLSDSLEVLDFMIFSGFLLIPYLIGAFTKRVAIHRLPLYAEPQEVIEKESPVAREVYNVALIPIIAFVLGTVAWVLMFGLDAISTALSGGLMFIPFSCCCYACGSAGSEPNDTTSDEDVEEE